MNINNQIASLPSATIFQGLAILEELKCGVATDFKLLCNGTFLSGIKLAQFDGRVSFGKDSSSFSEFRGKS